MIRPPIGIQTDRRIRVFLFVLSIKLFENNVLVRIMDKNIRMKFRTNNEMKYDIVIMGLFKVLNVELISNTLDGKKFERNGLFSLKIGEL